MPQRDLKGRFIGRPKEGDKECLICSKKFHYIRSGGNPPPKTCSKECRYKSTAINESRQVKKICVVCEKEFSLPFSWTKTRGGGKRGGGDGAYCTRECRYKIKMRWKETEKNNARRFIRNLIIKGMLHIKTCEVCQLPAQAHHYKGYDQENWLDIKWLCFKHHLQEHERLRKDGLKDLK